MYHSEESIVHKHWAALSDRANGIDKARLISFKDEFLKTLKIEISIHRSLNLLSVWNLVEFAWTDLILVIGLRLKHIYLNQGAVFSTSVGCMEFDPRRSLCDYPHLWYLSWPIYVLWNELMTYILWWESGFEGHLNRKNPQLFWVKFTFLFLCKIIDHQKVVFPILTRSCPLFDDLISNFHSVN